MHLLAIPYYGPNNQINSVLLQLFISNLLNMTAVIPENIVQHHKWKLKPQKYTAIFDWNSMGINVTHGLNSQEIQVVGETDLEHDRTKGYYKRYLHELAFFNAGVLRPQISRLEYSEAPSLNLARLISNVRRFRDQQKDVLLLDYGARFLQNNYAVENRNDPRLLTYTRELKSFINRIYRPVKKPCDIGVHLRLFDNVDNISGTSVITNMTYEFTKHANKLEFTFEALVNYLNLEFDSAIIMMPPVKIKFDFNNTPHVSLVQTYDLVEAQREVACCKCFVGDGISSVSANILRIRSASSFKADTAMSLKDFIYKSTGQRKPCT